MTLVTETLATLTIPSGQTLSPTLGSILSRGQLRTALSFLDNLTIISPQGIAEDIQVQISSVRNPATADWVVSGLIDVTAADEISDEANNPVTSELSDDMFTENSLWGGVAQLDDTSFKDLRLQSDVPVAANRIFKILAKLNIPSGV
jgi:hypothetical protein